MLILIFRRGQKAIDTISNGANIYPIVEGLIHKWLDKFKEGSLNLENTTHSTFSNRLSFEEGCLMSQYILEMESVL